MLSERQRLAGWAYFPSGVYALLAGTACLIAWSALAYDAEFSQWARNAELPGDLRRIVTFSEVFAHGLGVTFILGSIWLAHTQKRRVGSAILLVAVAGGVANLTKAGFVRVRPHSEQQIRVLPSQGQIFIASHASVAAAEPVSVDADFWDSRQRSFPSGHTATAWSLAIALTLLFPRAGGMFFAMACLASWQRISSGAHFPSDVLAGMFVSWTVAAIFLAIPRFRRLIRDENVHTASSALSNSQRIECKNRHAKSERERAVQDAA